MEAHGDERDPQQDVYGGEEHPHHVLLLLLAAELEPGDPDGGKEGEAVVESVDRADTVVGGNGDGAEAEVGEQEEETEPGGRIRRKNRGWEGLQKRVNGSGKGSHPPKKSHKTADFFP